MRHPAADYPRQIGAVLAGPPALAFMPAGVLGGYWLWGEGALILLAIGLPLCIATLRCLGRCNAADAGGPGAGMPGLIRHLDRSVCAAQRAALHCGCLAITIDETEDLAARHGTAGRARILGNAQERIAAALRGDDRVFPLGDARCAVALAPGRQLDTAAAMQIARRLQRAVAQPMPLGDSTLHVSASVGIALSAQVSPCTGRDLHCAADLALRDARRGGSATIRTYTPDLHLPTPATGQMQAEAVEALEDGQIVPWFQPQLCTDTGRITGVEALARWIHPRRGVISPPDFLPLLERAGRMERLSEVMLCHALGALKSWDRAGLDIPRVGVNFSPQELRNPRLAERIEWEIDRFDLTPDRLMVEILETVVSTAPDDTVSRNINALAAMGCLIDLDDFGTGQASIAAIRRFDVRRLKIDRSFVMKADQHAEQQRMLSAILELANRLGLDTLAEGVETAGEHSMLAQLGCGHVQGYAIARPMPLGQMPGWVAAHDARRALLPGVGRKTG